MPFKLSNLTLDEISLVDSPANEGARVVMVKRASEVDRVIEICCKGLHDSPTAFNEALRETLSENFEVEVYQAIFPLMDALRNSVVASMTDLEGDERDAQIRRNVEAFFAQLKMLPAKLKAGSPGATDDGQEADLTIEELTKRLGDMEAQVNMLKTEQDAIKKAVENAGFVIEKAEDGTVTLAKAEATEYVEIEGEKVNKADLPASVIKALDASNARIAKLEAEREIDDLRKRADKELPNLSGTADQRGKLLKAIDSLEDEKDRAAVLETLKAADAATAQMFVEVGKDLLDDESTATAKLDKLVKSYQEGHPDKTYHQAYAAVTEKGEGASLLRKSRDEQKGH